MSGRMIIDHHDPNCATMRPAMKTRLTMPGRSSRDARAVARTPVRVSPNVPSACREHDGRLLAALVRGDREIARGRGRDLEAVLTEAATLVAKK